jgi:hypothetical protein
MQVTNEKTVTADDIINESRAIWKKYRNALKQGENIPQLIQHLRAQHKEFCTSYPIVFRYMSAGSFSVKALRLYLSKIAKNPWKSESEYLDSQTDYVVMLYKATTPHWNSNTCNKLWSDTRASLQKETDEFKLCLDKCEKQVNQFKEQLTKKNTMELYNYLKTLKDFSAPLQMHTDLDFTPFNNILQESLSTVNNERFCSITADSLLS